MQKINIAITFNRDYIPFVSVLITSILENSNKDHSCVFHFISNDIQQNDKKILSKLAKKYNSEIKFYKCNIKKIEQYPLKHNKFVTYYKLYLPEILKDLDKVLYLDKDILIRGDISQLYNKNIKDYLAAVVVDNMNNEHLRRYPHLNFYFNAGVILMNLELMRNENVISNYEKYIEQNHMTLVYNEQDVLNNVLNNKLLRIEETYNVQLTRWYKTAQTPEIEIFENIQNPQIVHCLGPTKFWDEECGNYYSSEWKKYAMKTPYKKKLVKEHKQKTWFGFYTENNRKILNFCGIKLSLLSNKEINKALINLSNENKALKDNIERIKMNLPGSKLIVPYVEMAITTLCTLKCKDCGLFNAHYYFKKEKKAINFDTNILLQDIELFLNNIDECQTFRLIGGEPFLNSNWPILFQKLCNSDKVICAEIITNGTIIPIDEHLQMLKHSKTNVIISNYGTLSNRLNELIAKLKEFNIKYQVSDCVNDLWWNPGDNTYRRRGVTQRQEVFNSCHLAKKCKHILNGKLFVCSRDAHAQNLDIFPKDEASYTNLRDPKENLKEAIRRIYFTDCINNCNYCDGTSGINKIKPAIQYSQDEILDLRKKEDSINGKVTI